MKKIAAGGALLLGIAAVAYLLNVSTATPSADEFVESGRRYLEAGQYESAVIEFQNALAREPLHREGLWLSARALQAVGRWEEAGTQLDRLTREYPDHNEAQLALGSILLRAGRTNPEFYRQAEARAERVLENEPTSIPALILAGNAASGLQDFAVAIQHLERALTLDPDNVTALTSLATSRALTRELPRAEQAYLRALEIEPSDRSALLSLTAFYAAAGRGAEAERRLLEAVDHHPADIRVSVALVNFYYGQDRPGQADEALRRAQERMPQDPTPTLIRIDLQRALGRQAEAQALLDEIATRFPNDQGVLRKIAIVSMDSDPDRARAAVEKLRREAPRDARAAFLSGVLAYTSGDNEAATERLEFAAGLDSTAPQPFLYLGRIAADRGDEQQARAAFERSLLIYPQYLPARLALVESLLRQGLAADAESHLAIASEQAPDNSLVRVLRARLDILNADPAAAIAGLQRIQNLQSNPTALRQLGRAFRFAGNVEAANDSFRRALEIDPANDEILAELVTAEMAAEQHARALAFLNRAYPEATRSALHWELAGRIHLDDQRIDRAVDCFERAIARGDSSYVNGYVLLAAAHLQAGRPEEAVGELDRLLASDPAHAGGYVAKAFIYQVQGRTGEARPLYERALELDPDNAEAANNLAYLLADEGRELTRALTLAQTARSLDSTNSDYADTLGWIHYLNDNYVLAVDQLRFASSADPGNPLKQYHLGMALWKKGDLAEGQRRLRAALAHNADFGERPEAETALAQIRSQLERQPQ